MEKPEAAAFLADPGLISYPLSVLLLSLLFFSQQIYLAVGWGALAFGDAAANLAGQRWPGRRLSWNPAKSLAGLLGFWLAGTLASWGLLALIPASAYPAGVTLSTWGWILMIVMLVSAWAETLPGTLDDNLWVPLVAAGSAWLVVHGWQTGLPETLPEDALLMAIVVAVFMVLSWWSGKIDLTGTLTGGLLAMLLALGGGWAALGALFLLFVLGSVASAWGKKRKTEWGIAQEAGGKRSARHAFSNAGAAGVLGLAALLVPAWQDLCLMGILASLAAATSDTFSSEFGSLYGRRFVNILTLKPEVRGRDGVISLEGSLVGVAGALVVACCAGMVAGLGWLEIAWLILAATLANVIDSLLGASFQHWGLMTNDSVNFASTMLAAVIGMLWFLANGML